MWIAWVLSFTCIFIYTIIVKILGKFSPASLYFLTWVVALVLYSTRIVKYKDINFVQYMLIMSSIIAFATGSIMGIKNHRHKLHNCSIDDNKLLHWFIFLSVLSVIGSIVFTHKLLNSMSLPFSLKYLGILNYIIETSHMGIWGYLRILASPASLIYELYVLRTKHWTLFVVFLMDIIILAMSTRRTLFIFTLLSMFMLWFYYNILIDRIHSGISSRAFNKKLLAYAVLIITLIIVYFSFLQFSLHKSIYFNKQYFSIQFPPFVNNMIIYITASIAAIPAFMRMNFVSNVSFGYTLRPLYVMLNNFFPNITIPYFVQNFVAVPVPTNVVPYFMYFYFDGGIIYMIFVVFLIAYLSERFFIKLVYTKNLFFLITNSFLAVIFILSIRQNIFLSIYFWYFEVIFFIIQKTTCHNYKKGSYV